jgi:hypothetical protein
MDAYFGYEAIPCYLKKMYAVNLPPVQVAAPSYSPTKLLDAPLRYPVRRVERKGSILENVRSVTCCSAHDGDHRDFSLFGRNGSALVKLLA